MFYSCTCWGQRTICRHQSIMWVLGIELKCSQAWLQVSFPSEPSLLSSDFCMWASFPPVFVLGGLADNQLSVSMWIISALFCPLSAFLFLC